MGTWAFAQRTGQLRLFIDPGKDFQFVLDHKYRMQQPEVTLSEGAHHFTFWAPQRRMVDTTVTVRPDILNSFTLRLPYSSDYEAYKRELGRYRQQVLWTRAAAVTVTAGLGAWSAISFIHYRDAHQQLEDDEASYATLTVPRQIAQLKEQKLPDDKQQLKDARTTFSISTSLFALATAGTIYAFIRTGHRQVPVFEDQEKVRFEGLVWVPSAEGRGTWAAGLTIPLR